MKEKDPFFPYAALDTSFFLKKKPSSCSDNPRDNLDVINAQAELFVLGTQY